MSHQFFTINNSNSILNSFPKPTFVSSCMASLPMGSYLLFQPVNCHGDKMLVMAWVPGDSFSRHELHVYNKYSTVRERKNYEN